MCSLRKCVHVRCPCRVVRIGKSCWVEGWTRRGVSCGRKEIKKTSYNWCHAFLISLQTACHLHFPIFYFPVLFHIVSFWHASQHKICPHMYIGMLPGERITLKLSIKTLCRVLGSTRFSWAVLQCKHIMAFFTILITPRRRNSLICCSSHILDVGKIIKTLFTHAKCNKWEQNALCQAPSAKDRAARTRRRYLCPPEILVCLGSSPRLSPGYLIWKFA